MKDQKFVTTMQQDNKSSQKLTITLPTVLLQQLDRLAAHDFVGRSDMIRIALLQYVREPGNKLIADPDSISVAKMYRSLKQKHTYLNPDDAELIKFLYLHEINDQKD